MPSNSQTDIASADPSTKVFDRAKLLYSTDNDQELARVLIDVFLETAPVTLTSIKDAVVTGDGPALRSAAHSLKGAAATVTAGRVAAAAYALETCGASGAVGEAPALVERLEAALAELRHYLAA